MREEFEKMAAAGKTGAPPHRSPGAADRQRLLHAPELGLRTNQDGGHRLCPVHDRFSRTRPATRWTWPLPPNRSSRFPRTTSWRARPPTWKACGRWRRRNHLDLIKLVLNSYGGKATVDQIQQVLVPDVIRDDWKKWWEAAKRELKKDGHFQVPLKKTEPIVYQAKEVSLQDRLLEEFRAAKGLKARIAVAGELLKNAHDLADKQAAATEVIAALERRNPQLPAHAAGGGAGSHLRPRRHPRRWPGCRRPKAKLSAAAIWAQDAKLGPLMEAAAGGQASPRAGVVQSGQSRALARSAARHAEQRFRQALPRIRRPADPGRQDRRSSRKRWPG